MKFSLAIGLLATARADIKGRPAPEVCCGPLHPFLESANYSAHEFAELLLCKDNNAACTSWAAGGECKNNPMFMRAECAKSCDACHLTGSDLADVTEVALTAARNLALACEYGRWSRAAPCIDAAKMLPDVQNANRYHDPQELLTSIASRMAHEIDAICARPHCPFGEPHSIPVALLPRPPTTQPTQPAAADQYYTLNHGVKMPKLGLGTWMSVGAECTAMVSAALKVGFRHIDTSENYANHDAIGKALKASSVPRSELFLADKISLPTSYSKAGVRKWVETSLKLLGTDYLDLLMLHSVGPSVAARMDAWREMEALVAEGVVKAIGTSNFGTRDMEELRKAAKEPPSTAQIKYNPYHRGRTNNMGGEDFNADCDENGCVIVAYCPLNAWPSKLAPINDRWIAHIAEKYGKTPSQILLRWVMQTGAAALTRSRSEARLRDALGAYEFELSESDVRLISGLGWLVESPQHKPSSSVQDVLGVTSVLKELAKGGGGAEEERVEL